MTIIWANYLSRLNKQENMELKLLLHIYNQTAQMCKEK